MKYNYTFFVGSEMTQSKDTDVISQTVSYICLLSPVDKEQWIYKNLQIFFLSNTCVI